MKMSDRDTEIAKIWTACLSVLYCPMAVTDKIQTLEMALNGLLQGEPLPQIPMTGLEPFDKAVKNYRNYESG